MPLSAAIKEDVALESGMEPSTNGSGSGDSGGGPGGPIGEEPVVIPDIESPNHISDRLPPTGPPPPVMEIPDFSEDEDDMPLGEHHSEAVIVWLLSNLMLSSTNTSEGLCIIVYPIDLENL